MKKLLLCVLSAIIMTNIQILSNENKNIIVHDINLQDSLNHLDKSLKDAVFNKRTPKEVIIDLLAQGANPSACEVYFLRVINPVLRYALDRGTDKKTVEIIELLIAAGANVNVVTYNRVDNENYGIMPLLTYATIYSSAEIVQILVNAGAEDIIPDFENPIYFKKTALMTAKELKRMDIVKILENK